MSKQTINIGASPNDGTGTPLRTSFDYTNQNFTEIYTALGGGVALPGATTQVIFNDGGTNLAGDAGLVYNKTTDALTVAGLVTAGSATITGDLTVRTDKLAVTSTGVGCGTLTPVSKLVVRDGSNRNFVVISDASQLGSAGIAIGSFTDNAAAYAPLSVIASAMQFSNTTSATYLINGTTAMTLDSTGLGIGNTPIGKFDVYNTVSDTTVFIRSDTTKLGQIVFRDNFDAGNQGKLKYDHSTDTLSLSAGGNENLFLSSTGNLSLATGNVVMGTSGKGIDFSATANGSGTMTSELLNDYEEGTWTPVALNLTVVGSVTYTGKYTKIGRVVYIYLKVAASTSSSSVANSTEFSGLPFVPADNAPVTAVNNATVSSLGVGILGTTSVLYPPTWTSVATVFLSGFYNV